MTNAPEQKTVPNLTADERQALHNHKRNTEVVIREIDKGSAVAVMLRERYIAEANRQLSDTDVYQRVSSAVVFGVIEEVKDIMSRLHSNGAITEDMATYAVPVDSKPDRFYHLPLVHKSGCPGRPIVSAVGSPTEGLSELVDHFIQPFVPNIPSYIQNTQEFLDKLHAVCPLHVESILCTIDVTAPYPSIPHDDGLANLCNALLENSIPTLTISSISDMTELVAKHNVFEFNKEYFIQTSGTAIGSKLAPSYANLFSSIFERDLLDQYPIKPSIWFFYIDDIFMIWNDSENKHKDFLTNINTVNPAIQFTHAYSLKSVNFLDVFVTLTNDGTISADLYTKPTDTHQHLHMNSCHPNHINKAIAFLQATCISCICGDPATAQSRCNELIEYLARRGHGRRCTQLEAQ